MGQGVDLRKTARYRDVSKVQLKANGQRHERYRSRGWNREPKSPGISRVCSRFHPRRRKCQLSMSRICTILPTHPERRQLQIAYQKASLSAKPIQNRRSHRTAHQHLILGTIEFQHDIHCQQRAFQSLIYSDNDPHHRVAPSDANKFVNPRVRLRCMRLLRSRPMKCEAGTTLPTIVQSTPCAPSHSSQSYEMLSRIAIIFPDFRFPISIPFVVKSQHGT